MNNYNPKPQNDAEKLIAGVFGTCEREATRQLSRMRLENLLKEAPAPRRPLVRNSLKVAMVMVGLLLIGAWASGLTVHSWDDAQQISIALPEDFTPAAYPYWVALLSNQSRSLSEDGGHSIVIDYKTGTDGRYYLELGILGVDYSSASEWMRELQGAIPELSGEPYAVTQPLVPYRATVSDMIAVQLGNPGLVERNVVEAWQLGRSGERPVQMGRNAQLYVIARPADYARRVSMIGY